MRRDRIRPRDPMMPDSPLHPSAYDLLGVAATASEEELRRAYRLRLRQTHPDTGGDAALFIRVQAAWDRVGTPSERARYDRGAATWAPQGTSAGRDRTRPGTRSYGQAGGYRRLRYLRMLADHLGRTPTAREAADSALAREMPWEARRMLAAAIAEETTAAAIADLGMGFTAWHDVVSGADAAQKLAHAVLGPAGLYGLASEELDAPVRFRQGELVGDAVGDAMPVADLLVRVRAIARAARVRFAGAILILPDDALDDPVTMLGTVRDIPVAVVRRSALRTVLRGGIPGARPLGATEAFDVRTRLPQATRLLMP